MKRLGPELKTPSLKAPQFLVDVYWDLRDRHLLPLVALVAVAIVAVPFLLGGGSKNVEPPPLNRAGGGGLVVRGGSARELAVVQAKPGLRDYHKRLSDRSPTDPFKQRFAKPSTSGAELTETGGGTAPTTGGQTESSAGGAESGSGSGKTAGGGGGGGSTHHLTFLAFAAKVKIVRSGGKGSSSRHKEENVRERVLPQTPLPGAKAEVVTYMGISKKRRPLFLVSSHVVSVFGETHCVTGDEACQLIETEPGFPAVFIYGANEVHYTINVLKIEPVVVGHS